MNIKLINKNCFDGLKEIKKNSVDLIFCDLPYNCLSGAEWDQQILDLDKLAKELWRIAKKECPLIFTAKFKFAVKIFNAFGHKNFRYDLVYTKNKASNHLNALRMPKFQHENILVFYKKLPSIYKKNILKYHEYKTKKGHLLHDLKNDRINKLKYKRSCGTYEPRLPSTVQHHVISNIGTINPTQKPESLIEWIIKYYSDEGSLVLDPTFGSCTTGAVCKKLKRNFIGFEKDKNQYEKALKRITEIHSDSSDSS